MKPGPALVSYNRDLFAERLGWPPGNVRLCEWIEAGNPGWYVDWRREFGDKPAGFYARHKNHKHLEPEVYAEMPAELRERIRTHRCPQSEPGF